MKFGIILAARMSSRRLPGKAVLPIIGVPIISLIIKRLKTSKLASEIILATSDQKEDDVLAQIAEKEGAIVYRGSLNDVMARFVCAAKDHDFDYAVRVTGDEPFVDGPTLDYILQKCIDAKKFDLVTTKPAFPNGIDYEVYSKALLEKIDKEMNPTDEERENILNYIYKNEKLNKYKIILLDPPENMRLEDVIFLIDTKKDYDEMLKLTDGITDIYTSPSKFIEIYSQQKRKLLEKL